MVTADKLKVGDKVSYHDGGEKVVAKVQKKDDEKKLVHFIDTEDFEWEEPYDDIPETVKRILNGF